MCFFSVTVDSTLGKLVEKVGGVVHNQTLVDKGRVMREGQARQQGDADGMVAN